MELSSGLYVIENAHNRNWAVLTNDKDGEDVISGTDADENAGHKWIIKRLHNGTYLLRNEHFHNYASYRITDKIGDLVLSIRTGTPRHWRIKHVDGYYLISDLDGTRCWNLGNDHPHTPIALGEYTHSKRQLWKITLAGDDESSQIPASQSSDAPPPVLRHCPPPTLVFTGRNDILDKMHRYFSTNLGKRHVFVLFGLGGIGKSQILFKFVEECQVDRKPSRFSECFFIDATSAETIEADLIKICIAKGAGKSVADILRWLARKNEEWLLLFDNADDPLINLHDYFPLSSYGNIIVTSRNSETCVHAPHPRSHSNVPILSPDDAKDLFLEIAGIEGDGDETRGLAIAIVEELGHLALAIVQAGAYICKTRCSLAQYLEMYGQRRAMFLEEYRNHVQKIDNYGWTVYTTWTVSFEKLSTQAATFLNICAFFHHDGIPPAIFQKASTNITTREVFDNQRSDGYTIAKEFLSSFRTDDRTWDLHKFLTIITEIRSYSLIQIDERNHMYSIHPLVHAWTRSRVSGVAAIHECSQYILGMSIDDKHGLEDIKFRRMLLPHINSSLQGCTVADVAAWLSSALCESGYFKTAGKLTVDAMEIMNCVLREEHPEMLRTMASMSEAFWGQGRWMEAEELAAKVTVTRRRVLGEEHPDTLKSTADLAAMYWNQGRWKEAEKLNTNVIEPMKRVVGEEHPDTLVVISNLASTYWRQGRWKEAEELNTKVLELGKLALGEEHPAMLRSMVKLAFSYGNRGHWKEAEELVVKAIEMMKHICGEEHLDTLSAMNCLAFIYQGQSRWKEAEELKHMVMKTREQVLGDDHPDTLMSMVSLGVIYSNQGQWKAAEELQVKVTKLKKKILGDEHPDTLESMNKLAVTYKNQCQWKEAEKLLMHVMKIRKKVLGEEHPNTLKSMGELAFAYWNQGQWEEAEDLEVKVMKMRMQVLRDEHPDTLISMVNLGVTYGNQGQWKKAKKLLMQVVEKSKLILGEDHPHTLTRIGILKSLRKAALDE